MGKICWRRDKLPTPVFLGFPCGSAGKESTCNAGVMGSIPGWEDPLEKGKATHSSILAWRSPGTVVHGVTKSQTRWCNFHFQHPSQHPTSPLKAPEIQRAVGAGSCPLISKSKPDQPGTINTSAFEPETRSNCITGLTGPNVWGPGINKKEIACKVIPSVPFRAVLNPALSFA